MNPDEWNESSKVENLTLCKNRRDITLPDSIEGTKNILHRTFAMLENIVRKPPASFKKGALVSIMSTLYALSLSWLWSITLHFNTDISHQYVANKSLPPLAKSKHI